MAGQIERLPASAPPTNWDRRLRHIFGRDWKIAFAFIAPIVILMLLLIAWPFIRAIFISFTARTLARETRFVGLENYIRLYSDPFYLIAVKNTFIFTIGSIGFKFVFGLLAALLLHAQKNFRNLLTGIVLLPWIVPSIVQAMSWKSIYDPIFGGLNPILMNLGVISQPMSWLADPNLAMPAIIVTNVWAGIPFFTVNFLAGLQAVDKTLYEAAEVDGASAWDKFIHVTLPSMRYIIAVTTLLSTVWTFNSFEVVYLLTGGGPGGATRLYSIMAYEMAIQGLRFGPGTAVAFSLFPVLAFFILLLARYMRRDVDVGNGEEIVTWQDRIIDALGWTLGTIGTIVTYPIFLLISAISKALPQGKASRKRGDLLGSLLRGVGMVLMLCFVLFPLYWIFITSFKGNLQIGERTDIFVPAPWTLEQFERLFTTQPFWIWFRNSTLVAVTTTVVSVVLAALGGYALARLRFRGAQSMTTLLLITYLLPAALMFIPLYRILTDLQLINTLWALILTYPTGMVPFATWLLMGYYRSIPEDLEEAAMVDGATRLQAFIRVTLPLTLPAIAAVTLFSFTNAWKEFLFAFVFISNNNLMTLPVGMAQTIFGDILPWGMLMAASLLISIPVVIFYMFGQRFMIAGLTAGSVKG
ncbi:MAG: ABC transporter permease subunit [Litorilinea sp.]